MLSSRHHWDRAELEDLAKSWLVLSVAFAILLTGLEVSLKFLINFAASAVTVGLGFILHELAHKFMAEKYGAKAMYKADPMMLAVTLISSLFGFIFAAPGGVYILGMMSKKRNGIISLAGPLTNVVLALVFLGTSFISSIEFVKLISSYGFFINGWLAAFNMIPFGPFDGKKVFNWNKAVYGVVTAVAVGLVLVKFLM